MSDERIQYLEGLQTHPGWLLFKEHARTQWGAAGYGRQVKLAITRAKDAGTDIAAAVSAVDYANDEINALLSWPVEELKRVTETREREAKGMALSRRGAGL